MNLAKDSVMRKRMLAMVSEIYDKCVIPPSRASSMDLTVVEKKAIDRCVVKYLETAKYVKEVFALAIASIYAKPHH